MAIFGGQKFQQAVEQARAQQSKRPMDPYKAGGPRGYMARINQTRMGGRYQPGGDPRQQQQGGGGKPNRQMVQGNAGGMAGQGVGGGPNARYASSGQPVDGGTSGKANRRMQGAQPGGGRMYAGGSQGWAGGQGAIAAPKSAEEAAWQKQNYGGGGGRSGKPNRQTVPGNAAGGRRGRGRFGRSRNQPKREASALGTAAGRAKAAAGMRKTKGGLLS